MRPTISPAGRRTGAKCRWCMRRGGAAGGCGGSRFVCGRLRDTSGGAGRRGAAGDRVPLVRDYAIRAAVLAGAAVVLVTEALSLGGWISRGPLAAAWVAMLAGAAVWVWRHPPKTPQFEWRLFESAA